MTNQTATRRLLPRYAPLDVWEEISGMKRRTTYDELGRGNLKAVKSGARTLIDVWHGIDYMESLPPANIRAPKPRLSP